MLQPNGKVISTLSNLCLTVVSPEAGSEVTVAKCTTDPTFSDTQQFNFTAGDKAGLVTSAAGPSLCLETIPIPQPGPSPSPSPSPSPPPPSPSRAVNFVVDLAAPPVAWHKSWEECVGSSHLGMGLLHPHPDNSADNSHPNPLVGQRWREHLQMVAEELGMKRFRAHGLANDDVKMWAGVEAYNFTGVDSVYDFALSVGIRPLVEISYCPWGLNGDSCHASTDAYNASICAPSLNGSYGLGNAEYASMMSAFIRHLIGRYGAEEVESWQFEFWNEPNGMTPFSHGHKRECWGSYCFNTSLWPALYTEVATAIKAVDPRVTIGGPASSDGWSRIPPISKWGSGQLWGTWAGDLVALSTARTNAGANEAKAVPLDFVSSHFYPVQIGSVDEMASSIGKFLEVVKRSPRPNIPVVITEWSANPYPTNAYHDTAAMASFAVKAIHDVGHLAEIFSLWAFSDIFEEQGWTWDVFNGGFGLVNRFGVRKPVYRAFDLLHAAGNLRYTNVTTSMSMPSPSPSPSVVLIASTNSSTQAASVSLVLANHGSDAAANANIRLDGVHARAGVAAAATCTVAKIDSTHGNAYTAWQRMGSPEAPSGIMDNVTLAKLHAASELVNTPVTCGACPPPASTASICFNVALEASSVAGVQVTFT